MNKLLIAALLSTQMLLPTSVFAEDAVEATILPLSDDVPEQLAESPLTQLPLTQPTQIPTTEKEFVDAINSFTKAQIIEQLGEPAKADDIKLKDSGRVVASIWQYHNINTAADGTYYQTTELDFIDDKVVQVVFLNNDGTERENGQAYELPAEKPAI
ncbi:MULTISPECIES: hypothetical protein [Methylotenera]|uniref:hypothetical protein n=1 Tax=Methylotenera TaxID=359407 RepID=UPI00036683B4|nr:MULTISPECIES: hypothetical protein [Methylotenera]